MELDERSHILEHEKPKPLHLSTNAQSKLEDGKGGMEMKQLPDTPESSRSDLHQLVNGTDDDEHEKSKQYSSMPMASFNFINSIIGSGIIGIPYALKEAGFGLGLILILLVTLVTDHSLVLLIQAGALSNTNSYQDVMRAAFGRTGFILLTVMQGLYPLIAMISYNIIIGDTITKIVIRVGGSHLAHTIIGRREFVIIATTLVITLPLSLYRSVAKLSKMSVVSVMFVIFIMAAIITRGITTHNIPQTENAYQFANIGFTKAIGILAFAYMCHHNSFLIYDSIYDTNEKRWSVVTHISIFFSMVCTYVLGIAGYATFTGHSQGDILENYCHNDDLMNAARFFFAFTIMLTYPIECFVLREVIENAVFAFQQPSPLWRHLLVTVCIVVVTVIVSMATDCLGIVLELNGIINASPLAFIFPALCVLKLQNDKILSLHNITKLLLVLFGTLVTICGLVMIIIELVNGVKCSHGVELDYCKPATLLNQTTNNLLVKTTLGPL